MGTQSSESSSSISSSKSVVHIPLTVLAFLALLMFFAMLLVSAIYLSLEAFYGTSVQDAMKQLSTTNTGEIRNYIRLAMGIHHTLVFMVPALLLAIFFSGKNWLSFLSLRIRLVGITFRNCLLGILLIFSAFPLAQFTFWLNKQIPLPEWARTIEDSTNTLLRNMLGTESALELSMNILVIAVLPAIGEELVFRGVLQRTLEKWIAKPHLAIVITAIIFSAFHMQFEGFIPRFLLGALLGYLFYWSGNLWVPIAAHFANNAVQVIAMYLYSNRLSQIDIEKIDRVPIGVTVISIIFVLGMSYTIVQFNKGTQKGTYL